MPLVAVDEKLVWDKGEGDQTRDWWIEGHRRNFSQQAKDQGFTMHDGIKTVFKRFMVVSPESCANLYTEQDTCSGGEIKSNYFILNLSKRISSHKASLFGIIQL